MFLHHQVLINFYSFYSNIYFCLDMFIFQVELSEIFLQQFDSTIIHNNQSLLDFIPAEDPNWKDLADHMNSPC